MDRRKYTEDEIAHATAVYRSNGGNMKRTAAELGWPRSSLRAILGMRESEGKHAADVDPAKVTEASESLAKRWRKVAELSLDVAEKYLARLPDVEKIAASHVRDLLVGAGVATEKESFARGGPTARTESVRISLVAPDVLRSDKLRVIEGGKRSA